MAGNNGASQFSAFAALTGFEDLIEEHNQIYEARREPSEEELQILSEKISGVHKGSKITLTFYNNGRYETLSGMVTRTDFIYRIITVNNKKVFLDDIISIEIENRKLAEI